MRPNEMIYLIESARNTAVFLIIPRGFWVLPEKNHQKNNFLHQNSVYIHWGRYGVFCGMPRTALLQKEFLYFHDE